MILKTGYRRSGGNAPNFHADTKGKGEKMQKLNVKNPYIQTVVKRTVALTIMVTITVSSVVTVAAATCNATVERDGKTTRVQLFSSSTADILAAAGVKTDAEDLVARSGSGNLNSTVNVVVKSGYRVLLSTDHTVKTVVAHYGDTVADVLEQQGVTVGEKDMVLPGEDTAVTDGMKVTVKRKYTVNITADGASVSKIVTEGSVAQALDQAGVTVGEEDLVTPAPTSSVAEGMKLTVQRVTYNDVTTTESVAYAKKTQTDGSLYKRDTKIDTKGKNGSCSVVTRQKLVDGKMVSSQELSRTVVTQPVDQVTLVGTKDRPRAYASISADGTLTDQNGNKVSYSKKIVGRCTAYTGGGHTSTGRPAAYGLVAVNPSVIPYGTQLYIASPDGRIVYGYAIAADTGGAAMAGRIVADLYYNTGSQCDSFGVRNMAVYVLS